MRMRNFTLAIVLALCAGLSPIGKARDLTFIVASDLHYYGNTENTRIQKHIERINAMPGTEYPPSVGGVVGPISGVILNGDLTDSGNLEQWKLFTDDWGLTGDRRCRFPLYEGLGNHDFYSGDILVAKIAGRTMSRPGVAHVSTNGLHYAWEWDGIRFLQLNQVPDLDTQPRAYGALSFLREDLAEYVGDSRKPVIVNIHISPMIDGNWPRDRQKPFLDALSGYNVIAVFCGHSHGYIHRREDGKRVPDPDYECRKFPGSSIGLYDAGSLRDDGARPKWKDSGRFFVVNITDEQMTVIMNTPQGWGTPHIKQIQ